MYYVLFDTETTGLGSADEVIQLSAILLRDKTPQEKAESKNSLHNLKLLKFYEYYCDTTVKIAEAAYNVHHIDATLLHQLSGGKTFEDNFIPFSSAIREDVIADKAETGSNICWVAYGAAFDKRLINQTLTNNGLPSFDFGKTITLLRKENCDTNFCLLKAVKAITGKGVSHKLESIVKSIYSSEVLQKAFSVFAKNCEVDENIAFHNATYDIFCTYLVMEHFYCKIRG